MARKKPTPDGEDILAQIRRGLQDLRLTSMLEGLEEEAESGPRDGDTRYDFLWRLLERQLRQKQERSVERRIKDARFPAKKSLDNFDFAFQTGIDRERVMELAALEFVRRGQNVLIAGMSGTGKSHIAISLGYLACAALLRVRYTTSAAMLAVLQASLATSDLPRALKRYLRCDLLIIDEVGLDSTERSHAHGAQLFYKVVSQRYDAHTSTILTSNIPWNSWADYFDDGLATVPILDRLVHRGFSLNIDGPSWRAAEHQRLNQKTGG